MKVIPANELENHIGEEVGVSDWFEVTQERINQFAEATNDHQFIHVDPEMRWLLITVQTKSDLWKLFL